MSPTAADELDESGRPIAPPWHRRIVQALTRPEYVLHPEQFAHRLGLKLSDARRAPPAIERTRLPWGLEIAYHPEEIIGSSIRRLGLFDLLVSELCLRLPDPGELAIDAGANIGHMSGLLALGVGREGEVMACEPHPEIVAELRANVERWREDPRLGAITVVDRAVSDATGEAVLTTSKEFAANRGSARLAADPAVGADEDVHTVRVPTVTLAEIAGERTVGVLKLDIEGHEAAALRGAEPLLASGRLRDVLFEASDAVPNAVTDLLERHGYAWFALEIGLRGPRYRAGAAASTTPEQPLYLATREPTRTLARVEGRGWRALARTR